LARPGAADDLPLYLFDKQFAAKAPKLAGEYDVPGYFTDDMFALLGKARYSMVNGALS